LGAKSLDEYFERFSECITRNHIDPDDIYEQGGKKNELVSSRMRVKVAPGECDKGVGYGLNVFRQLKKRLSAFIPMQERAHYGKTRHTPVNKKFELQ